MGGYFFMVKMMQSKITNVIIVAYSISINPLSQIPEGFYINRGSTAYRYTG